MKDNIQCRIQFLNTLSRGALNSIGVTGLLWQSCDAKHGKPYSHSLPTLINRQAPDGELVRAGLVGCGGRGTGAAVNFLDAGPNLEIVALGGCFSGSIRQVPR